MGFFEEAEKQKQQQIAQDPDYGKTNAQIASEHSSELLFWGIIIIVLATVLITFVVRAYNKHRLSNKTKSINMLLEKKKSWRVCKVMYWLFVIVFSAVFIFINDGYGSYPLMSFGLLLVFSSFPLYLLFKKLYLYINNIN